MKHFSLRFIQIAWVTETIVVLIFSMIAIILFPLDRINMWMQFLPLMSGLIAAQGTAAGIGPLVADKIRKEQEQ